MEKKGTQVDWAARERALIRESESSYDAVFDDSVKIELAEIDDQQESIEDKLASCHLLDCDYGEPELSEDSDYYDDDYVPFREDIAADLFDQATPQESSYVKARIFGLFGSPVLDSIPVMRPVVYDMCTKDRLKDKDYYLFEVPVGQHCLLFTSDDMIFMMDNYGTVWRMKMQMMLGNFSNMIVSGIYRKVNDSFYISLFDIQLRGNLSVFSRFYLDRWRMLSRSFGSFEAKFKERIRLLGKNHSIQLVPIHPIHSHTSFLNSWSNKGKDKLIFFYPADESYLFASVNKNFLYWDFNSIASVRAIIKLDHEDSTKGVIAFCDDRKRNSLICPIVDFDGPEKYKYVFDPFLEKYDCKTARLNWNGFKWVIGEDYGNTSPDSISVMSYFLPFMEDDTTRDSLLHAIEVASFASNQRSLPPSKRRK